MATGTEMMLSSLLNTLFKFLGIEPKEAMQMILETRERVLRVDTALAEIRERVERQNQLLEIIAAKLEVEYGRENVERPSGERQAAE